MSASDLYATAEALLEFCVAALDELPLKAPERQYVSFGLPALDCEQITVHVFQVGEFDGAYQTLSPADQMRRGHPVPIVNVAALVVTVVRDCYPGPVGHMGGASVPEAEDLALASQGLHADGWQLWNAIRQGVKDGHVFGACRLVDRNPMQPLGPEGNFAGWTVPVLVSIPGFDLSPAP